VPVKVPRVRDRGDGAEKVRFALTILPPYLRKAKSIEELLPWLYRDENRNTITSRYRDVAMAMGRIWMDRLMR